MVMRVAGDSLTAYPAGMSLERAVSRFRWMHGVLLAALLNGCASSASLMAVNVPLCDLRQQPRTAPQRHVHDPLEETQLLYGEQVRVIERAQGWARIEALEQPEFTHAKRWQGYPGWVPEAALISWEPLRAPTVIVVEPWASTFQDAYSATPSPWRFPLGTRLHATDMGGHLWQIELLDGNIVWMPHQSARSLEALNTLPPLEKRRLIVHTAERLLGERYYWGGRSLARDAPRELVTGVDCSGLVNLAYRSAGVAIPRDAHEQFLRAKRVSALQPGDLIFLSEKGNPHHIVHVMLYVGNREVIEGPGTGERVRRITIPERLGQPLDRLSSGSVVDEQTVFFGSYL